MKKEKQIAFVVWKGRTTGIFKTWVECAPEVLGFKNAEYMRFNSLEEACVAFIGTYEAAQLKRSGCITPTYKPLF